MHDMGITAHSKIIQNFNRLVNYVQMNSKISQRLLWECMNFSLCGSRTFSYSIVTFLSGSPGFLSNLQAVSQWWSGGFCCSPRIMLPSRQYQIIHLMRRTTNYNISLNSVVYHMEAKCFVKQHCIDCMCVCVCVIKTRLPFIGGTFSSTSS